MSAPNNEGSAPSTLAAPNGLQSYAKNLCDAGTSFLSALLAIQPESAAKQMTQAVRAKPDQTAAAGEHDVSLLRLYYMARGKDTLSANLAEELHDVAEHVSH